MTEGEEKIQWSDWEGKGKAAFLNNCNRWLGKNGVILDDKNGLSGLPRLVYDLFWHGIYSSLRVEQVTDVCYSLIRNSDEMGGLVLDVLNIYDAETSVDVSGESRKKLAKLTKSAEGALSKELLQERMEIETLGEFKIVTNKSFYTKFIKIKTKLYYKQNKFNLFREESEGYAKLVNELNQSVGSLSPETALENIKSLIGCFNLDPTRVLDAMLDSFESRPDEREFFSPLISSYLPDKKLLCEVMGFKYTSCDRSSLTPPSLHNLTIAMIHDNIVTLDEVYPWLSPDDKAIHKEVLGRLKETESQGKKTSMVSVKDVEGAVLPPGIPSTAIPYEKNQKISLGEALLDSGDWASFQQLMVRLSPQYLLYEKSVALAMCRLIHYLIEPVYRKQSGLGSKIPRKEVELKPSSATPAQAQTLLALRNHVLPMLYALGASLHYDPVLIFKVIRLATAAVSNIKDADSMDVEKDTLYYDTITLLDEVLLPTLSYLEANCCVAEAIWNIIKVYPLHCRYAIYTKWKDYTNKYQSEINKKMQSKVNIKACMKRVSKENVKQVGRLIGKLSHYSPAALFDYIIIQIQMYDNLIGPVVDSLKYLNSLSYDVLGFSIIDSLRSNKKRVKHDGNSLAPWFQSMANFCAAVYKKYNVELSGLLFYTLEQLKSNKSIDLVILKEILNKMAGIEVTDELTDNQLEALGGGEILRSEAGYFVQQRNTKKSSARLKEALVKYNLGAPLAIMIAQERYHIVFSQLDEEHLKFVGKLYDECHETLLQFATFMAGSPMLESTAPLPDFHRLVTEFHLELDVAFLFTRPSIVHRVMEECTKEDGPSYMESMCVKLRPLVDTIKTLQPERTWEDLSPEFIALFWSLTLYDIRVPCDSYQREITKLKQQLSTAQAQQRKPNFSDSYGTYPASSTAKPKKEIERIQNLTEKLKDEKTKHKNHVNSVLDKLKQEKDNWFVLRSQRPAKNEMITQFLQMCIFPRCMSSALDAHYCAHFIHTLHSLHAANFSTLLCYDRLFCDISYTVTSCTENEANRYGRFLCAVLENVMRWHSDKEIYDKECAYTPGFVTKFRGSNEFSEPNDNVHYENYRHVCHKWHYKITKSLINLLESKEYIQIRNAIIILIRILPHFPVISRLAQFIEKRIVKVMEEEKKTRQDLCILATSYCGQLMSRIPHMMKESEFHVMVPSSQQNTQDSTTATVVLKEEKNGDASSTPQMEPAATKPTNSEVPVKSKKSPEEDATAEGERKRNHKEEKHKKETSPAYSDDERILEEYTEEYLPLSKDDSSKHSAKKTSSAETKEAKRRKPEKRPPDSETEKKVKKLRKARTSVVAAPEEEKERKQRKVTKKRIRTDVTPGPSEQGKRRTKESKSKVPPDDEVAATDKKRRYSKEKSPTRISRDKKYSAERKVWR